MKELNGRASRWKGLTVRRAPALVVLSAFGFVSAGLGDFNRTTGLIDMPTAKCLERNVVKVITNTTFAAGKDDYPAYLDFGVGYGLFGIGELVLNAYTSRDYSAHLAFKLTDENGSIPAFGLGIQEVTYRKYISSVGGGDTVGFPDDVAYLRDGGRPSERFSLYLVATKDFRAYGEYTMGIGRGRFVGYGPCSHWFNTDNFRQQDSDGSPYPISDLAFGLFMGARWKLSPNLFLLLEFDGRDGNAGLRYEHRYFEVGIAGTHLEQIVGDLGLSPRVAIELSGNSSWMYELAGEGVIICRVVDATSGSPLVATLSFPDTQMPSLSTSREGLFKLRLPAGTYTVLAGMDGYFWKQKQVNVPGGRTVTCDFALERESPPEEAEGILACLVVAAGTDSPLVATLSFPETEIPPLRTSPEGVFKLKLAAGTYTVEARKDGYQPEQAEVVVPGGGMVACNFSLQLESSADLARRDRLIEEHLSKGLDYFAADSLFEAANEWAKVLTLDPSHQEARRLMARIREIIRRELVGDHRVKALEYAAKGDARRALDEWEAILSLDPDNVEAKMQVAQLKARLSPRPSPERVSGLFKEGLSLFLAEQYEEALKVFNEVLSLDPTHKGASEYRDKARARLRAMRQ